MEARRLTLWRHREGEILLEERTHWETRVKHSSPTAIPQRQTRGRHSRSTLHTARANQQNTVQTFVAGSRRGRPEPTAQFAGTRPHRETRGSSGKRGGVRGREVESWALGCQLPQSPAQASGYWWVGAEQAHLLVLHIRPNIPATHAAYSRVWGAPDALTLTYR